MPNLFKEKNQLRSNNKLKYELRIIKLDINI